MSDPKRPWTPGKWWVTGGQVSFHRVPRTSIEDDGGGFQVRHEVGEPGIGTVCTLTWQGVEDREVARSTARLIALAPELFEALVDLVEEISPWDEADCSVCGMHAEHPEHEPDCQVGKARSILRRALGDDES